MAIGAQWKHAGRVDSAQKKGQIIGKLCKEIIIAAKAGVPDPDHNARLRAAIEAAKKSSVPRENIDRAIKKGAGTLDDGVAYELVTYEGFAPHKVPVIIECQTENKNRTASDIRVLFRKGQLGNPGAVAWMFDRLGMIEATHQDGGQDIEAAAIEAGAQDVEPLEAAEVQSGQRGARFYTAVEDLDAVNRALSGLGWTISASELSYRPKSALELGADARKEVESFLGDIDDNDDVHRVYAGIR